MSLLLLVPTLSDLTTKEECRVTSYRSDAIIVVCRLLR